MENPDRVTMTVAETAKYLGVHEDTIYTMVRQHQIPHIRVRRRIFFRKEALDAWMSSQEMEYKNRHDSVETLLR